VSDFVETGATVWKCIAQRHPHTFFFVYRGLWRVKRDKNASEFGSAGLELAAGDV
jgi:hypothetical protein